MNSHHGGSGHDPRDLSPRGGEAKGYLGKDLSLEAIMLRPRNDGRLSCAGGDGRLRSADALVRGSGF